MLADLHTHSTASDGILSPYELVKLAKARNLAAIAITDHDTVDGLSEGLEAGKQLGITVVPGIELSTQVGNWEIHILGYFIDYSDGKLNATLEKYTSARLRRGEVIIQKLKELGIYLDWESILNRHGEGSVGRPHIARALMANGYVDSIEEAFHKYLNPGTPAFVPRLKLEPFEAIKMIRSAFGIPVLAHPGLLHSSNLIDQLISYGLMGIEVYYPLHTPFQVEYYSYLCEKNGLVPTGGSDFHGIGTSSKKTIGLSTVDYEVVEKLKKLKNQNNQL
jgi:predicted metal-dependent phosphoesterase TrpH